MGDQERLVVAFLHLPNSCRDYPLWLSSWVVRRGQSERPVGIAHPTCVGVQVFVGTTSCGCPREPHGASGEKGWCALHTLHVWAFKSL